MNNDQFTGALRNSKKVETDWQPGWSEAMDVLFIREPEPGLMLLVSGQFKRTEVNLIIEFSDGNCADTEPSGTGKTVP